MSDITYYSIALLMTIVPAWALVSGKTGGVWWWRSSITRQDEPLT